MPSTTLRKNQLLVWPSAWRGAQSTSIGSPASRRSSTLAMIATLLLASNLAAQVEQPTGLERPTEERPASATEPPPVPPQTAPSDASPAPELPAPQRPAPSSDPVEPKQTDVPGAGTGTETEATTEAPPVTTEVDEAGPEKRSTSSREMRRLRRQTHRALSDGAEDFGLTPVLTTVTALGEVDEQTLVKRAEAGWVLAAELARSNGQLTLRLLACPPAEGILRVKRVTVDESQIQLSVVRFLRDVLRSLHAKGESSKARDSKPDEQEALPSPSTDGRAYLAVTGALVGGYVGFAMEHIAGSSDARLTYPLMTLGAGIGVGASLIAAEEWHVSTPEAVYLSGTTLWSTAAALLMTDGTAMGDASRTPTRRHAYGLLGTASGLSLGTLAISVAEIDQGGALLVHSGAVYGGLFGVLTQRLIEAEIDERPTLGLGAGLGAGTVVAGVLATQLTGLPPDRLVYVDLSAFLGGLTGAAVATPVIVGNEVTETETRIWFGSILLGTLAGAGLGYIITEPTSTSSGVRVQPTITQLAPPVEGGQPGWSLGLAGTW